MIAALLIVIFILLVVLVGGRVSVVSPDFLFLPAWLLSCILLQMRLIEYYASEVISIYSFFLIILSIMAFILGVRYQRVKNGCVSVNKFGSVGVQYLYLLILMSMIYAIMVVAKLPKLLEIYSSSSYVLNELRAEHWEEQSSGHDFTSFLMALTRPFAFIIAVSVSIAKKVGRRLFLYVLIVWLMLFLESVLAGGRFQAVLLVLATFFSFVLVREVEYGRRNDVGTLLAGRSVQVLVLSVVGVLGFYVIFGIFPAMRNPNLSASIDTFLGLTSGAKLSDFTWYIEESLGLPNFGVMAYGTSYITSPIMRLTYFLSETDISSWYSLGSYNFPQFGRLMTVFGVDGAKFYELREDIALVSIFGENPWKTGFLDVVIDFGIVGALIFLFLYGRMCEFFYFSLRVRPTLEKLVLVSFLSVNIFSFAYSSKFYVGPITNTAFLCMIIIFAKKFLSQIGRG